MLDFFSVFWKLHFNVIGYPYEIMYFVLYILKKLFSDGVHRLYQSTTGVSYPL